MFVPNPLCVWASFSTPLSKTRVFSPGIPPRPPPLSPPTPAADPSGHGFADARAGGPERAGERSGERQGFFVRRTLIELPHPWTPARANKTRANKTRANKTRANKGCVRGCQCGIRSLDRQQVKLADDPLALSLNLVTPTKPSTAINVQKSSNSTRGGPRTPRTHLWSDLYSPSQRIAAVDHPSTHPSHR